MRNMAKMKPPQSGGKTPDPDPPANPVLSFRVEPELHAVIREMAGEERRKMAQLLAILVEEAVVARGRFQRKPPKPTK